MRTVHTDDVGTYMGPASVKRPLSTELDTTDVSINYFELEPGESFAFGYHSHADQEEVFYLLGGTAVFETGTSDDPANPERVEVGAGEAIRFAPGEYQQGHNEGTERVVALAFGAPRDAGETDIRRECGPCEGYTSQGIELTDDREALVTNCVECGTETGRFD
jgi:mannose-6-phosphate isomerase-like protein (cupin superfamily)